MNYLFRLLMLSILFGCSTSKNIGSKEVEVKDGDYRLIINTSSFQFRFENSDGLIVVPEHNITGLLIDGTSVSQIRELKGTESVKNFNVINDDGVKAKISVSFEGGIAKFSVNIENNEEGKIIELQAGGMPVAHGLGDAGSYGESFNLLDNSNKTYSIINNGGTQRWTSTFAIFPKNNFAGVYFTEGKKEVTIDESSYSMKLENSDKAEFYFFLGNPKSIYKNYKTVRNKNGFHDVLPKSRLFELGWESWDALGWNTNQVTVKEILQQYLDLGYPIKWAITGSGFWEEGGTTTSFGRWGKKFDKAEEFKSWMHGNDIKWMIGLRTNFIPEGGPYYPESFKKDRNLKESAYNGNDISSKGLEHDYFVKNEKLDEVFYSSRFFPQVPSYLVDGNNKEASQWYANEYLKWKVDGIKEDTMMHLDSLTEIYNGPMTAIAENNGLVMARNGNYSAPGTLSRINDTHASNFSNRIPINYLQYAASGAPNVYSDVAGIHNMKNQKDVEVNLRHTWLLSLTAGLSVGHYPNKWTDEHKAILKKAIDFHYNIVPYIYDAAVKTYKTGFPYTLTPTSIAFSEDDKALEFENYQWMIGESLLATPLLKNHKSAKKDIYLPEGIWFDYESGEKFLGPILLEDFEISLDKTPIFVGGKGILVERNYQSNDLVAKIYPLGKTNISHSFTYPNGKDMTKIEIKNDKDTGSYTVKDLSENRLINFSIDERNGSINFRLQPNHNYQIKSK